MCCSYGQAWVKYCNSNSDQQINVSSIMWKLASILIGQMCAFRQTTSWIRLTKHILIFLIFQSRNGQIKLDGLLAIIDQCSYYSIHFLALGPQISYVIMKLIFYPLSKKPLKRTRKKSRKKSAWKFNQEQCSYKSCFITATDELLEP